MIDLPSFYCSFGACVKFISEKRKNCLSKNVNHDKIII